MSTQNQDSITTIKGIGAAREKWFKRSFGIGTIDQFSQLSLDEILRQAKHDKIILQRSAVESWLAQAELLASTARLKPRSTETEHMPHKSADIDENRLSNDWEPIAQFVIEIQVKTNEQGAVAKEVNAHHVETDQNATWDEIRFDEMGDWMRSKIDPALLPLNEEWEVTETADEMVDVAENVEVELDQAVENEATVVAETIIETAPLLSSLQVSQIIIDQQNHRFAVYERKARPGGAPIITPNNRFNVEVVIANFDSTGLDSLTCEIKCHALNLHDGSKHELGTAIVPLGEGESASGQIEQVSLPKGAFKLYVLAHTLPMVMPPDLIETPILHAM